MCGLIKIDKEVYLLLKIVDLASFPLFMSFEVLEVDSPIRE